MELLQLTIQRLTSGGSGLAHYGGETVFVPFAAPGDEMTAQVTRRRKGIVEAERVTLHRPGAHRRTPPCPLFGTCGGCQTQHLEPAFVHEQKREWVVDGFRRIAHLEVEGMCAPLFTPPGEEGGYRRRAAFKARITSRGAVVGFYAPRSRTIVDLPACPALVPPLERLIAPLRALLESLQGAYEEVMEIEAASDDEGRTALLFHLPGTPSRRDRDRLSAFAVEQGLAQTWLRLGEAEKWSPLRLEVELSDQVAGQRLAFRPGEFVQAHAEQNRRLVDLVLAYAWGETAEGGGIPPGASGRAWDLFCGIGNFTLPLARLFHRVIGVEGNLRSVERARRNASANGVENVRIRQENLFSQEAVASLDWSPGEVVVLDPPREGAEAVCARLADHPAGRVVYVSCDPATLARDAARLIAGGWRLDRLQPVEMFPWTRHVEAVARFVR
ncbi:MAG: methyltransferase domain-containing protein [Magnetococcales bacterium]|nr:methyltransferase domain-containing protein [Magnetococcales bacterium]